ncbi:RNA ligase family protein [Argonema antarcticum]|uniref:RNA ligase family protein n=1 Tax=Argonema antarcticum TaxID=2942763 RepID=UPI002012D0C7|nr:RNA ligase family protein [Argonema antarcticum]MCL1470781.1 RNA ligase [Argonema antarcticum A004/B2]
MTSPPTPLLRGEGRKETGFLDSKVQGEGSNFFLIMDMLENNLTDWNFISYDKIPETPKQWNLTESDYRAFKKTDWVVTEKIHGANFAIVTDGENVRFAKRKEFLPPDEDFFGFKSLESQLVDQVKEIFMIIQAETSLSPIVSVYGELFGGEYPHPEVSPILNVQAVQTGIYYSPKIEYCAFDIAIVESGNSSARNYTDYNKAMKIFDRVDMMCAQPLFIGKYESAITYNIEFDSTIPALLGLPKLLSPNKAEGVVIKPIQSIYLETPKGIIRPILKRKIAEFAEDSRFHQARKWNHPINPTTSQPLSLETELEREMLALVTPNRLNNAISKIGRLDRGEIKNKEMLLQSFVTDVLENFNEDYADIFSSINEGDKQNMIERLNREAQRLIDNYTK